MQTRCNGSSNYCKRSIFNPNKFIVMSGFRLALVVSHPIQHFCPQYVSFAQNKNIAFKVFFASTMGFKKYVDPTFKKEIAWDNLNLDKFDHEFLNGDQLLEPDNKLDAPSI